MCVRGNEVEVEESGMVSGSKWADRRLRKELKVHTTKKKMGFRLMVEGISSYSKRENFERWSRLQRVEALIPFDP